MVGWLCRFFRYLETSIAARRSLPPLNEVGLTCFYDRVYKELNGKVRDAVISIVVPKGSVTELAEETEAGLVVQDFVRKVIELHDKYLSYVLLGAGALNCLPHSLRTTFLKIWAPFWPTGCQLESPNSTAGARLRRWKLVIHGDVEPPADAPARAPPA
ncbi:Cullin [Arachis hypogaea]|nr:Cullin [Arachis hypogaea]